MYLSKLSTSPTNQPITLAWTNGKFLSNFELANTITQVINSAFLTNSNINSKLYLKLTGINQDAFDNLVEGENIGLKSINKNVIDSVHSKDLQLSYVENGQRQYVSIFNSLNIHEGSMSYQANTILVVKENANTGNNVYVALGVRTTINTITEADRL